MRVRHPFAAICVSIVSLLVLAGIAAAATPTTVNVRIEGATETLFEGPISATAHGVKATSDTVERRCDGINSLDPWNTAPAPTATSASVDALSLAGETFDGLWYPGYDDYFIKRFGPDAEKEGKSWGILVNNTFTDVGGCQFQVDARDEVLWAFNAFNFRPFLALFPAAANYVSGPRPLTATATLGQPFEVEVVSYEDDAEDNPPAQPGRAGAVAFAGADVSPVTTAANGFEKVETADPATVVTDHDGKAQITFTTPGWHRIKATVPGKHEEEAVRSNRLDVCVPAVGQTSCPTTALSEEDEVRVPQATLEAPAREQRELEEREAREAREAGERVEREAREAKEAGERVEREAREGREAGEKAKQEREAKEATQKAAANRGGHTSTPAPKQPPASTATPGPARVSVPTVDRKRLKQGRVVLSWKVLDPGAGVRRWTINSQALGVKKAAYVKRASGTAATSASLRLPPGAYRLQLTVVDALGRASNVTIGKVVVPGGGHG